MIRLSFILCLVACGNKEQSDTSEDTAVVEDTTPTRPDSIIVLQTSGKKICLSCLILRLVRFHRQHQLLTHFGATELGAHVFVLRVMLRGDYEGPGVYNTTDNSLWSHYKKKPADKIDTMRLIVNKETPPVLS